MYTIISGGTLKSTFNFPLLFQLSDNLPKIRRIINTMLTETVKKEFILLCDID